MQPNELVQHQAVTEGGWAGSHGASSYGNSAYGNPPIDRNPRHQDDRYSDETGHDAQASGSSHGADSTDHPRNNPPANRQGGYWGRRCDREKEFKIAEIEFARSLCTFGSSLYLFGVKASASGHFVSRFVYLRSLGSGISVLYLGLYVRSSGAEAFSKVMLGWKPAGKFRFKRINNYRIFQKTPPRYQGNYWGK